MLSFETFTSEEIFSIFEGIGLEVECIVDDEDEYTSGTTRLICDLGGIEFTCVLIGEEPFFDGLSLFSLRSAPPNPLYFCNRFNSGPGVARAYQTEPFDDEDDLGVDENGRMELLVRLFVHFGGGVTKEHLEYLFYMWIEDLYTFNEIEDEDDDEDELEIDFEIPNNLSEVSIPLIERITAYLELRGNSDARSIAKALRVNKQKVNGILYRNLKTFQKSPNQPPIWSLLK